MINDDWCDAWEIFVQYFMIFFPIYPFFPFQLPSSSWKKTTPEKKPWKDLWVISLSSKYGFPQKSPFSLSLLFFNSCLSNLSSLNLQCLFVLSICYLQYLWQVSLSFHFPWNSPLLDSWFFVTVMVSGRFCSTLSSGSPIKGFSYPTVPEICDMMAVFPADSASVRWSASSVVGFRGSISISCGCCCASSWSLISGNRNVIR